MSGTIVRRLERLERVMGSGDGADFAQTIEDGRRRAAAMTHDEIAAAQTDRLASLRTQHVDKALRGLELMMMLGLQRVVLASPEASQ